MRICFDTGPLSAFAQAGRLSVLEGLCRPHDACMTPAVRGELREGAQQHPALRTVLDAQWLAVVSTDELELLRAFVTFSNALGAGERHLGECTVLAWASCHQAVALLDDDDARTVGRREGVKVCGTLALIADGIRSGTLHEQRAGANDVPQPTWLSQRIQPESSSPGWRASSRSRAARIWLMNRS